MFSLHQLINHSPQIQQKKKQTDSFESFKTRTDKNDQDEHSIWSSTYYMDENNKEFLKILHKM